MIPGYEEHETAKLVAEHLHASGVDEVHTGIGGTGVVGVVAGRKVGAGRCIGLRAELDCLALDETTGLPWASRRPGLMHACGHDGHVAILLAAASYLATTRDFAGTVCFVFQPAEEGGAGAKAMIDDGLLTRFPLEAVYAIHNAPWIPSGEMAVNPGPMMAAADHFRITVAGSGGHGGMPHLGADAILAAAQVVVGVQSIVARHVDPFEAAVVSFGAIQAGSMRQHSVMPARADLIGTVRTYSPDVQEAIESLMGRVVAHTCEGLGVSGALEYARWYPATINHPREAGIALEAGADVFGARSCRSGVKPSTAGEDFAFLLRERPGAYVWLGQGRTGSASLHSPNYDFDDRLIPPGAALLACIAERELAVEGSVVRA
ncbi:hydrolase [Salinarimonas ramus]|uniref:Hydrolase n=2 Tax=Salinarimonas ramus TaxID=690164 RepID=A0A917Q8J2_9HYPH|nr:hydrolase [Salinarimonas ramus]